MNPNRPWRVEYMNAEGEWLPMSRSRYATKHAAEEATVNVWAPANPGVQFRQEKHVDFEASR